MKTLANKRILMVMMAACAGGGVASAHAFLDHAEPKVGSEVAVTPTEVKIWFTEAIEPAFSKVQVLDADGKQIDKKDFHLDAKDKKLAIVSVPPLLPGKYKVTWQVVASDTHKTEGDFTFTVTASKGDAASAFTRAAAPATTRSAR